MTLYEIIKPIMEAHEMGLSLETEVLVRTVNELTAKLPGFAIEQLDAYQDGMHDSGLEPRGEQKDQ